MKPANVILSVKQTTDAWRLNGRSVAKSVSALDVAGSFVASPGARVFPPPEPIKEAEKPEVSLRWSRMFPSPQFLALCVCVCVCVCACAHS
jgi:hypothetical protein